MRVPPPPAARTPYVARPLSLLALLWAGVSAGCTAGAGEPVPPDGPSPPAAAPFGEDPISRERVAQASNHFGFRLLHAAQAADPQENHLLSPLSASLALGLALSGAEGETGTEMSGVLGLDGVSPEEIGRGTRALMEHLRSRDPAVEIEIANSLWMRDGFDPEADFLARASSGFDARARSLDFSHPSAATTINGWVAERTRGRIETIVPPVLDPATVLFLINALYFKGAWTDAFDPTLTRDATFRGVSREADIPLMRREGRFPYRETADAQVVELSYGEGAWALTWILPAEGRTLAELVASLDAEAFADLLPERGEARSGRVELPRFRMEYERTLNEDLKVLGMRRAFDGGGADFSRLHRRAREQGLHISSVLQKTFAAVDEEGTEAAAVTSVEFSVTSAGPMGPPPFHFRADRPFLYVLRERDTGAILFTGTVSNPPDA